MIIRPTTVNDIQTLQQFIAELFVDNQQYDTDLKMYWPKSPQSKEYFSKVVNNKDSICLLAEEENKAVGYICATPKEFDHRLKKYIEIENMEVTPNFRSQGIGEKLVNECLRIAKEKGFDKVYVCSYSDNSKAISFYEKIAFKKVDVGLERDL